MNKKTIIIIAVVAVLLIIAGVCIALVLGKSNKNPLVGKWQSKDFSSFVYTFNEDGTGDYSGMKLTYTTEGNNISITFDGSTAAFKSTYEIKGNELNIKDSFGNDTIYTKK